MDNNIECLAKIFGPLLTEDGAFEWDRHGPAFWKGSAVEAIGVSTSVGESGRRTFAVGNLSANVYRRSGVVTGSGYGSCVLSRSKCAETPEKDSVFIECP